MAGSDDIINGSETTYPDTTWPNTLRMQANSLVGALDQATKELACATDVLGQLDGHNDLEAKIKANLIRKALCDLATALLETTTIQDSSVNAVVVPPRDTQSALIVAETGLIFNTVHPIAHL